MFSVTEYTVRTAFICMPHGRGPWPMCYSGGTGAIYHHDRFTSSVQEFILFHQDNPLTKSCLFSKYIPFVIQN